MFGNFSNWQYWYNIAKEELIVTPLQENTVVADFFSTAELIIAFEGID